MFTVIAGALSYAGYIAVRLLGSGTGLLVTSAAGALISSTAVAVEFARQARDGAPSRRLAGAASLACMVSAVRVMALITIVQPKLLMPVAPPALAATLAFGLAALLLVMSEKPACEGAPVKSENPLRVLPLLGFAAMLGGTQFAVGCLASIIGPQGILASTALVGIVDVDVAVLSAVETVHRPGGMSNASAAILLAMTVNALARLGYAAAVGPAAFTRLVAAATLLALAAGVLIWNLMPD